MSLIRFTTQSVDFFEEFDGVSMLKKFEKIARVCYKSEDKITDNSYDKFLRNTILHHGHESIIEHDTISLKVTTDRGISHQIVRHRVASYAQESTRYCNYTKHGFTYIIPLWVNDGDREFLKNSTFTQRLDKTSLLEDKTLSFVNRAIDASNEYEQMVKYQSTSPGDARALLPECCKTEIVMTMNIREYRHFLKLRTAKDAHPQIREIGNIILDKFSKEIPILFEDIVERNNSMK